MSVEESIYVYKRSLYNHSSPYSYSGVILYVLLVGAYPFTEGGEMDVQILRGRYNIALLKGVSRLAKDLLAGLLQVC
ncbi:hypothetical protein EON63_04015 [archaeon]|nr:MAG: hypothetical protein EON63_04015 [archaeon]